MPTSPNLLAGLSNAPASTTIRRNNYASGYPISPNNIDGTIDAKLRATATALYQFPLDLPKYHFVLIENEWKGIGGQFVNTTLQARKIFKLQLPTPLTDSFEVDYDQNYNYLESLTGLAGNLVNAAARAAGAALGLTLNTLRTVTMTAPKYRTFDFTWKFSPKNFQEAQEIRKITFALRKGMAPKRGIGNTKLLLEFPYIYTMYFAPNLQYLYKFKPCVLAACNIDYQGGNPFPGFYKQTDDPSNSPPESVVLSTRWIELEYWLDSRDAERGENTDFDNNGDIPTDSPFDAFNHYSYSTGPNTGTPVPTNGEVFNPQGNTSGAAQPSA